jgi:hypothetical protein
MHRLGASCAVLRLEERGDHQMSNGGSGSSPLSRLMDGIAKRRAQKPR